MAALTDNRIVTGLEEANRGNETSFTVATCEVDDWTRPLLTGCRQAVPLLIERLKKGLTVVYGSDAGRYGRPSGHSRPDRTGGGRRQDGEVLKRNGPRRTFPGWRMRWAS